MKNQTLCLCFLSLAFLSTAWGHNADFREQLIKIQRHLDDEKTLAELLPIVRCSLKPSKYEEVLTSQLRATSSSTQQFRSVSEKIGELLVNKVVECLPVRPVEIQTPIAKCTGAELAVSLELVSIMRSGDALLNTFIRHFPEANVSKILIQRDEQTAEAQFKYMKMSPTIASGSQVIITEPLIATGGTLEMVLNLLKERGVAEENITVASILAAPEGLLLIASKFPDVKIVISVLDQRLNERKYIVPGLGDFGDRYFGTEEHGLPLHLAKKRG